MIGELVGERLISKVQGVCALFDYASNDVLIINGAIAVAMHAAPTDNQRRTRLVDSLTAPVIELLRSEATSWRSIEDIENMGPHAILDVCCALLAPYLTSQLSVCCAGTCCQGQNEIWAEVLQRGWPAPMAATICIGLMQCRFPLAHGEANPTKTGGSIAATRT